MLGLNMLAIELFVAMQTRKVISLPVESHMGVSLHDVLVNGMTAEDGSGASWIIQIHDMNWDKRISLYIRTADTGKAFVCKRLK